MARKCLVFFRNNSKVAWVLISPFLKYSNRFFAFQRFPFYKYFPSVFEVNPKKNQSNVIPIRVRKPQNEVYLGLEAIFRLFLNVFGRSTHIHRNAILSLKLGTRSQYFNTSTVLIRCMSVWFEQD